MRWTILILALPVLQAQVPGKSVNELKAFFASHCVKCHGLDGSAHNAEGKPLAGLDFTDASRMAKESDAMMVKTIRKGIFFGVVMHPFKNRLTEADARLLVTEILRKAEKGKVIAPGQ